MDNYSLRRAINDRQAREGRERRRDRGATDRLPAYAQETLRDPVSVRPVRPSRPIMYVYAFSALVLEGDAVHHFAGYIAQTGLDKAFSDALEECYAHFPPESGFTSHNVHVVPIHGVQLMPVEAQ